MIRILHTADSHIGVDLPARPRRFGARRGDDIVRSFERVLALAQEHAADLVIHAGDLFDRSRPTAGAVMAATQPLRALAEAGIPVVIVPGNHDRAALQNALLLNHPKIHMLDTPRTVVFELHEKRVSVSGFACIRRDAATLFEQALNATRWAANDADVRLLVVHQAFDSAVCGANDYRFRKSKDVVDRASVPDAFDYVAAGHVHRYQRLKPVRRLRPEIVYAGSPDRVTFAERDEPKGAVLVEFDGASVTHAFIEQDVRPMLVSPLAVSDLNGAEIWSAIELEVTALPENATAQIRLTGIITPAALRELRIAEKVRNLRPDVLVSVTVRGMERTDDRSEPIESPAVSLADSSTALGLGHRTTIDAIGRLPSRPGVYAFFDEQDRVLYVGKATNLRSRVRSHVKSPQRGNFYAGWANLAVRVEARLTANADEAHRIEQQLIERWRPPFNVSGRFVTQARAESANGPAVTMAIDPNLGSLPLFS